MPSSEIVTTNDIDYQDKENGFLLSASQVEASFVKDGITVSNVLNVTI